MFYSLMVSVLCIVFSSCKKEEIKSNLKDILSFYIDGQVDSSVINAEEAKIHVIMPYGTNLTALSPDIEISEKATINPASGESTDFSIGEVKYLVTAEDKSIKEWIVAVNNKLREGNSILSYSFKDEKREAVIRGQHVYIEAFISTDYSNLEPEITISDGASISPATGEVVDLSSGKADYTIIAEDGNSATWEVIAQYSKMMQDDIISFTIPGQLTPTLIEYNRFNVEVPFGTDLTDVIPSIVLVEGTSISPDSGVSVDASETQSYNYKITSNTGVESDWTMKIKLRPVEADNPNFQYVGRIDFTDPKKPRFWAPGVYIATKFRGTFCDLMINDQVLWGTSHNYLEIVIDGNIQKRIQTTGKENTIRIAEGLSEGEHTLLICKDTEAGIGYLEFVGLLCDEVLAPDPLPERKIEFIGNSITCGYGNDDSEIACGTANWYDQHNAYMAYGPVVARRLNAQWVLSSVSGIGMIHSCCDNDFVMSDVYGKIDLSKTGKSWNFSRYAPDVVTICLGQNDGVQDSTAFCSAYVSFIETVRSKYANAHIVCLTSPMGDATLTQVLKDYLTGIVNHMNAGGDNKIHSFFFSKSWNNGCDWHPSKNDHQEIADELEAGLKGIMGW